MPAKPHQQVPSGTPTALPREIVRILAEVTKGGTYRVAIHGMSMEAAFSAPAPDMEPFLDGPSVVVTATSASHRIAEGMFVFHGDNTGHFEAIWVEPRSRRRGVATALYDMMSSLGAEPIPSDVLDDDGIEFWKARKGSSRNLAR